MGSLNIVKTTSLSSSETKKISKEFRIVSGMLRIEHCETVYDSTSKPIKTMGYILYLIISWHDVLNINANGTTLRSNPRAEVKYIHQNDNLSMRTDMTGKF